MRVADGEVLNLEWRHVHLEPAPGAKHGYIHIPGGKSENARRNAPITNRLAEMLLGRSLESKSVFPSETGRPYLVQSVDHLHKKVRGTIQMSAEIVIYSLCHTWGTRLGAPGADAFTIKLLMGHSSVTVSQRYVHLTPGALERALEKLQAMNTKAAKAFPASKKRQLPATGSATVDGAGASAGKKVLYNQVRGCSSAG